MLLVHCTQRLRPLRFTLIALLLTTGLLISPPAQAAPPTLTAINAGGSHTCARTSVGGVTCWGANTYGQLGNGTTVSHAMPFDVSGLTSGVTMIATGDNHTCARTNAGGVKCWGSNTFGQFGDGTTTNRVVAVDVTGLASGVMSIGAGSFFTCALINTGGVKCWGANVYGQLGDGTTTDRVSPVASNGISNSASRMSAGGYHACISTITGSVKCWGNNSHGQLGDGTTTNRSSAVIVSNMRIIGGGGIVAGRFHTCANVVGGIKSLSG